MVQIEAEEYQNVKKTLIAAVALLSTATVASAEVVVAVSTIDFGPLVNELMKLIALLIGTLLLPLMWAVIGKTLRAWGVEAATEMAATRAVLDGVVQKAMGGAIAKFELKPGHLTYDTKSTIVNEAASTIVRNASESLKKLGVPENEKIEKAKEMVMSRLGLMEATAAGNPVPNPSQQTPVPPNPVSVNQVG